MTDQQDEEERGLSSCLKPTLGGGVKLDPPHIAEDTAGR